MTDEEIIFRLRDLGRYCEVTREEAADRIEALVREHAEDQFVIAVWRGRTERAERERNKALTLLRQWLIKYGDDGDSSGRQLNEKTRALLAKEGAR